MGEDDRLIMDVGKVDRQSNGGGRVRKKLLYKNVCKQMEFYFSDANLGKDRYLSQLLEDDPYIPLKEFLKFNKLVSMVNSVDDIAKAIKKSDLLELSDDKTKVRRKTPISIKENEEDRTIYVENLAPETTHEDLIRVFSEFGKVLYVSIPKYSHTHAIKGFAFVEFDTEAEATKTLQIFQEKGSCLSSQMLPEKLCSIRSFEDPNRKEAKSKKVTFKFEHDFKKENQEAPETVPLVEMDGVKVKLEKDTQLESTISSVNDKSNSPEFSCTKENKLKRKGHGRDVAALEKSEDLETKEKKKRKVDPDVVSANLTESSKTANDTFKEPESTELNLSEKNKGMDSQVQEEDPKRNRNRKHKKKTKPERDLFAFGMHILPKKEWRRLRNKYLNMQRSNMSKVKQQLAEARFMKSGWYNPHQHYEGPADQPVDMSQARVSFTPGVIIRVGFNEPVADIKLFKTEAKSQPSVQYVDIHEGSCEAYLRCLSSGDAQQLLQSKFWENMSLVQGNEENAYWEKIYKDREEKLSKKKPPRKKRGREKLLHRAETLLATHLHFDS